MSLSPTILPALAQLGLLEELKKISLPSHVMELYHENLKAIGTINAKDLVDM